MGSILIAAAATQGALLTPLTRRTAIASAVASLSPLAASASSSEVKEATLARARAREAAEAERLAAAGGGSKGDPLTLRLIMAREELGASSAAIDIKDYDGVRKTLNGILPLMTFSGYTGESVKARAEAWYEAGNTELSKEILTRRNSLMRRISSLENGLYAAQTNNKKTMKTPEELQAELAGTITALDAVIEKMGCERRWQSGKCEILPLPENAGFERKRVF